MSSGKNSEQFLLDDIENAVMSTRNKVGNYNDYLFVIA
jgi:hypothetical protein